MITSIKHLEKYQPPQLQDWRARQCWAAQSLGLPACAWEGEGGSQRLCALLFSRALGKIMWLDEGSWQASQESLDKPPAWRGSPDNERVAGRERGLGEWVPGHTDIGKHWPWKAIHKAQAELPGSPQRQLAETEHWPECLNPLQNPWAVCRKTEHYSPSTETLKLRLTRC